MMNTLIQWATALVLCAAAGLLIRFLVPEGGTKKAVHVAVCVFLLCAVLSPFAGKNKLEIPNELFEEKTADDSLAQLQNKIDYQLQMQMEQATYQVIEDILKENHAEAGQITVQTDIQPDHRIVLNKICLTLSDQYALQKQSLSEALGKALGCDVEIAIE